MLSIRCVLFGICKQRANFVKHAGPIMKYQYAFLHNSFLRLAENTIEIKMPSLSPTMTEGTIVKWLKKEGDSITPGDVLCEIQTDKAVVGLEIEEEGILSKILVPENTQNVQLGEVIAVLIGEGEVITEKEIPLQLTVESSSNSKTVETPSKPVAREYQICGPSVKKLLTEYGIKYSDVPRSGPKGNLLKGDVLKFIQNKQLKQIPIKAEPRAPKIPVKLSDEISHVDIPVSSERRTVAEQLIQSKIAMPHAYMNVDCKIGNVFSFIKKMKQDGLEVSINDFLIKSVAAALRKVPEMNVMNFNGQVQPLNSINVSITAANDSGYLSATIKNADELTIQLISEQMNTLASQTVGWQYGQEKPTGGSFRICNLGVTGVSNFSEIIYPPEVAVLTIGTVQCVFEEEIPIQRMKATLSFNNQLISGNEAGSFLNHLKQFLENPLTICLS